MAKKKFKLIFFLSVSGIFIFILLIWKMSLSKTVKEIQKNFQLKNILDSNTRYPEKKMVLKQRIKTLSDLTNSKFLNSNDYDQRMIKIVDKYCLDNNLIIRKIPERTISVQDNISIITSVFSIEGDFVDLVKLIYMLEQKEKLGRVTSANLTKKTEPKTKTSYLIADIFLQNIIFNESNEAVKY
jgi:hypothetical protein